MPSETSEKSAHCRKIYFDAPMCYTKPLNSTLNVKHRTADRCQHKNKTELILQQHAAAAINKKKPGIDIL